MADYTMELQTGLIELRWLHYGELRGAGPATTATEEQGKTGVAWLVTAVAGRGCQLGAQTRTCYRAMGDSEMCSRRLAALP